MILLPLFLQLYFLHFYYSSAFWHVWFQVYALTRERDTLRREQNKKSDATALLKEKDEIINQVMAEGVKFLFKKCIPIQFSSDVSCCM